MSSFQKTVQHLARKRLDTALIQDIADALFDVNMDIGEALLIVKLEFEKKINQEKLQQTIDQVMEDIQDALAPKIAERILLIVEPPTSSSSPRSSPRHSPRSSPRSSPLKVKQNAPIRRY